MKVKTYTSLFVRLFSDMNAMENGLRCYYELGVNLELKMRLIVGNIVLYQYFAKIQVVLVTTLSIVREWRIDQITATNQIW